MPRLRYSCSSSVDMMTEKYASHPRSWLAALMAYAAMGLVSDEVEKGDEHLARVQTGILMPQMLGAQVADGLECRIADDHHVVVNARLGFQRVQQDR